MSPSANGIDLDQDLHPPTLSDRPMVMRLMAYENHARMNYRKALSLAAQNGGTPDITATRREFWTSTDPGSMERPVDGVR